MTHCARCDWTPDPSAEARPCEQLDAHASAAGHPRCVVCAEVLSLTDPTLACESCLTRTREDLAGIVLLWQELPRHLGHARSQRYDSTPGRGDGQPLPGGEILALLGPGSSGQEPRRLTANDLARAEQVRWWVLGAHGPLTAQQWNVEVARAEGKEHLADNAADDSISVAEALASWERDWRDTFDEPAPSTRPQRTTAIVRQAAGYLERRCRWAAGGVKGHPGHLAFDEFAEDMRQLHHRLELATGRVRNPETANAKCFDCGKTLVRRLKPAAVEQWWLPGAIGPVQQIRVGHGLVEETVHLHGVEQPIWTCTGCGHRYDQVRYDLALKAAVEARSRVEIDGEAYATARLAAGLVQRSEHTIKEWVRQGLIRSVRHEGLSLVSVDGAERESETRPRRVRRELESHACA